VSELSDPPHILVLTNYDNDRYEDADPDLWDFAEIVCPHEPSSLMPCATWVFCGCRYNHDEITDPDWGGGQGPCPKSAIGTHTYLEGIPHIPSSECWPVQHADGVTESAFELFLPLGKYTVFPTSVDGSLCLDLYYWVPTEGEVNDNKGGIYSNPGSSD
jgi:hypothetical protein